MVNNSFYDIIIVGAKAAGSSLAVMLGERGYNILLLDRSRFLSVVAESFVEKAKNQKILNEEEAAACSTIR